MLVSGRGCVGDSGGCVVRGAGRGCLLAAGAAVLGGAGTSASDQWLGWPLLFTLSHPCSDQEAGQWAHQWQ